MAWLHNIQPIEWDKNSGEICHRSEKVKTEFQLSGIESHLVHGLQCVESCRANNDKWTVAVAKTRPLVCSSSIQKLIYFFLEPSAAMPLHAELSLCK